MSAQPRTTRISWTDERLDDLALTVRDGFARVETQHRELRTELDRRFDKVDDRLDRMDKKFDTLQVTAYDQIAGLNRNMIAGLIAIISAMFGLKLF